jgi:hypothetical protein
MSQADQARNYCKTYYIDPARKRGDYAVTIRAGDVHKALKFQNRFPLVCSALGSKIFEESFNLKRISVDGPLNGANTLFTFLFKEALKE